MRGGFSRARPPPDLDLDPVTTVDDVIARTGARPPARVRRPSRARPSSSVLHPAIIL